jgi:TonB family protein
VKPAAEPTEIARKLRLRGSVPIELVVEADGTPRELKVSRPVGYGMDEKALEAARKWRFQPCKKDGKAAPCPSRVSVGFPSEPPRPDTWETRRIIFASEGGLTPPVISDAGMPMPAGEASDESIVLDFTVDASGSARNIVSMYGAQNSADLLISFVARWKFQPAVDVGRPAEATGRVLFAKGEGDLVSRQGVQAPIPKSNLFVPEEASTSIATAPTTAASGPAVGASQIRTTVNATDGQKYVWIPAGTFTMGCSPGDTECKEDEKPPNDERIAKGFWLGQTEVTQAAYQKVTGGNPSAHKGDQLPVESLTWNHADNYCRAIGGRLPTEVEWEYAARAGSKWARYGNLDDVAWHSGNSDRTTHPVARKQPNSFSLYDMLGNVWEWVADNYPGSSDKMLRGGAPFEDPLYTRASSRLRSPASGAAVGRGFRCAGDWPAPENGPQAITRAAPATGTSGGGAFIRDGVYRFGNGVSAPQLLFKVEPIYTEIARKAKFQGTVVLYVEIDPSGRPVNPRVIRALGMGLDENAVECVLKWRFKPAYKDGKPVTTAATIEVNFRLL